ncbi:LytTR family DNA-binding domain-containing protein [Flavobacteriaceae bacterium S356]|uniref:LytTR family DNA-binding domain-containing protein n=1 Tax=Asprobacillus argus TaxID=3076534 RepID=A0ABU3LCW1_9FLAO|nr:LytTR family DNA-binding domain-containing protein [Flavobacteriaceae bacterium S356]
MKKHLTCIIVDDEPPAIRLLEKYVEKIPSVKLVNTFTKPLEVLQFLESQSVDIVFLDIQMPEITGIQLSKIINKDTHVIFTTAYPEFALESYDVAAMDYLLKPIEFERFYKAVEKVQPKEVSSSSNSSPENKYIFFKTDGKNKFKKVFLTDVLFFQGLKNYVAVQLEDEQIITYSTLKHILEMLPKRNFIQVHKSYIVSIEQIDQIENDAIWIKNRQVPIGNTYRKGFFEKINSKEI